MLQQCSSRDVNLRGIFLVFGGLIGAAAIVVAVARTFPVRVCGIFIFIIIGRRPWRRSVFTPLLLCEQLKKAKKEMLEIPKKFREFARISSISKKTNLGIFSLRFYMVTFFPELAKDLPKEVEVFFKEERGSFPESRTACPSE
jgi:hypothetical protein